jgi:1-acyl-sn-glycerol-3-phosphate acyltransferase
VVAAVRAFGAGLARVVLRVEVVGRHHVPSSGPVLLAGNHSGILDGPLVFFLAPRPPVLLAKSEIFVRGFERPLGWLGMVPVHRGAADRAALHAALAELRAGGVVGVFPEGSRGTGALETVNDGLAYLALRSGAPVVPLAVTGTAAALPKGKVVPRFRSPVRVAFGAPLTLDVPGDARSRRTVRAAAEQLRTALVDHLRIATEESA